MLSQSNQIKTAKAELLAAIDLADGDTKQPEVKKTIAKLVQLNRTSTKTQGYFILDDRILVSNKNK